MISAFHFAIISSIVLAWGTSFPASQVALRSWPPMLLNGFRCETCGILITALTLSRGYRPWNLRVLRVASISGALNVVGAQLASVYAVEYLSGGLASLLIYLQPLLLTALAWPLFKERITKSQIVALTVGFIGLALVVLSGGSQLVNGKGVLIALGAALSWALGIAYLRYENQRSKQDANLPIILLVAGPQFLIGGTVIVLIGWFSGFGVHAQFNMESWLAALLFSITSAVGWLAYLMLLQHGVPVARIGAWSFGVPLFANIAGVLFLSEPMSPTVITGGLAIIAAIIVIERKGFSDNYATTR